jgi:hypothetical protein
VSGMSVGALAARRGIETWEKYCRARWQWSKQYAYRLILAAEYRAVLPEVPNGTDGEKREWNEFSMRELRRIPDKKEAARVAKKVIAEVDKTPDAKLTSTRLPHQHAHDQDGQKQAHEDCGPESHLPLADVVVDEVLTLVFFRVKSQS